MSTNSKVVILGAGPSGLGTALGLQLHQSPHQVTILEKKSKPGGLSGSFQWKGHLVDFGPHRLSPNLESVRLVAREILGPDILIKKSQHGVQFKNRLYQFPPRVIDFLSLSALWNVFAFGINFLWWKLKWITHRFGPDTFQSTINRKFGARFNNLVVSPMAEKVWIAADKIDATFVNQRFAQIQPSVVIKKLLFPKQELNPSCFFYPRHGFQQIWDNMSDYVQRDGQDLQLDSTPSRIRIENNRIVQVAYQSAHGEKVIDADQLEVVSTIPIVSLLRILDGIDKTELNQLTRSLKFRSMILGVFELNQERTLPFRTLIFPEKEYCFNRLFEQNEYSRDTVESGKSLVVADITCDHGAALFKETDQTLIDMIRRDLKKLKYFPVQKVSDQCIQRVEFAYVVPDTATRLAMHQIHHRLKAISNLHLMGRFSVGEYDNSDYAIDNGLMLGSMLSNRTSKLNYLLHSDSRRGRPIVG